MLRFIIICFCIFGCNKQNSDTKIINKENFDSAASIVQKKVDQINSQLNVDKVINKDIYGYSTEGGELTAYMHDSVLHKMVVDLYGEMGRNVDTYYFIDGKLFFMVDSSYSYNRPVYYDSLSAKENGDNEIFDPNKSKRSVIYYFFKNDSLIKRQIISSSKPENNAANFQEINDIKNFVEEMKKELKTK